MRERNQPLRCRWAGYFTAVWSIALLFAAFLPIVAFAAPLPNASASAEPVEFRPGGITTYTITIEGGAPDDPEAPLKLPAGLEQTTVAPAIGLQSVIVNGARREAATLTWQIRSEGVGTFTIPPQTLTVRGVAVTTEEVRVVVKDNPSHPAAKYDPIMTLEVGKREFYIGEVVPITVNLYIHRDTMFRRAGLIELPKESLAIQRFPLQGDESVIKMGGVTYRALAFNSTLSALKVGKFKVGPATSEVTIEVPSGDTRMLHPLLRQSESRKIRPPCNDVEVTVLPLPSEGVPKGFNNLVGDFELSMTAEPLEISLNDPIAVEMTITGTGNFDAVSMPTITDPDSWKTYPARRYNVQSSDNLIDGAPRSIGFSQVIVPKKKSSVIPPFELSYFSPTKKQYVTLRTGPVPIVIKASEQSIEPSPATVTDSSDKKGGPDPDSERVPKVKPQVTDILAHLPDRPTWLAARPTLWGDRAFRNANYMAAGTLLLLILGKVGAVAWRAHVNSPLAPTRKLWRQLHTSRLSRARFYELASTYIASLGLSGEKVQAVLDRHNAVNFGKSADEAEELIPREERDKVLNALRA